MVLWEITLGTAYFLGLKRTYRLALKIQRGLVSPKHPKIRSFLHRRTRNVFDVARKVHQNVQKRDIEVGRNFGNWILRWLDRMKPFAQIRGNSPLEPPNPRAKMKKQTSSSSQQKTTGVSGTNQDSGRHLFTASSNMWSKPFPTISMIMRPPRPAGTITQYRQLFLGGPEMASTGCIREARGSMGVIRNDIVQYLKRYWL